jgi:hypothetical protein
MRSLIAAVEAKMAILAGRADEDLLKMTHPNGNL